MLKAIPLPIQFYNVHIVAPLATKPNVGALTYLTIILIVLCAFAAGVLSTLDDTRIESIVSAKVLDGFQCEMISSYSASNVVSTASFNSTLPWAFFSDNSYDDTRSFQSKRNKGWHQTAQFVFSGATFATAADCNAAADDLCLLIARNRTHLFPLERPGSKFLKCTAGVCCDPVETNRPWYCVDPQPFFPNATVPDIWGGVTACMALFPLSHEPLKVRLSVDSLDTETTLSGFRIPILNDSLYKKYVESTPLCRTTFESHFCTTKILRNLLCKPFQAGLAPYLCERKVHLGIVQIINVALAGANFVYFASITVSASFFGLKGWISPPEGSKDPTSPPQPPPMQGVSAPPPAPPPHVPSPPPRYHPPTPFHEDEDYHLL